LRLRPGPVTEASAVFGVGWIVSLIIYMVALRSANVGWTMATFTAATFFMPAFVFQALGGLIARRKSALTKFLVNLSVTSLWTLAIVMLLQALTAGQNLQGKNAQIFTNLTYIGVAGFYIGTLVGAAATYFWLTREKK